MKTVDSFQSTVNSQWSTVDRPRSTVKKLNHEGHEESQIKNLNQTGQRVYGLTG